MTQQIALVSKADQIGPKELARAAAALNTQLRRDFGLVWHVDAQVTTPRRVPGTAWPLIVSDDAPGAGVHTDADGRPVAYVDDADDWTKAASHELLEMCADPCEAVAYEIDGVAVSQPGDDDYHAADAVSRTFAITRPLRTVPNVTGQPVSVATGAITKNHCRTGTVRHAYSAKKKGLVISQANRPRTLPPGSTIGLVISSGPRP